MLTDADLAGMRAQQEEALPDLMAIDRPTGTTSTNTGARIPGVHAPISTNVPCRVTPAQIQTSLGEQARPMDIHRFTIRCPRGTDIQERDIATIDSVRYEVEGVKSFRSWETVQSVDAYRIQ